MHAHNGENQYHAIMNNGTCAMVHPSSTARALLGMGAQVELIVEARQANGFDERVLRAAGRRASSMRPRPAGRTDYEHLRSRT